MIGRIYSLKNPITDEIRYIGQTRLTIEGRLTNHWRDRKQSKHKNNHTAHWINKLWVEHKVKPIVELIKEWDCTDDELNTEEIKTIHYYGSQGFNLTNHSFNKQFRRKTSPKFVYGKKIYCYNKETGEEQVFINGRHAEENTGITYRNISRCCVELRTTTTNLTFSFTQLSPEEVQERKIKTSLGVGVVGTNMQTGEKRHFLSQQEAAKVLGVNFRNINQVLKGIRLSCGGYKWAYENKKTI